jgi:hypothetical protein
VRQRDASWARTYDRPVRKALRYRLFGMGKMPEKLKNAAAGPDVVLAAEGLPVSNRVASLRIPGATVGTGVRSAAGSLVILPGRLLASIGTHVILDTALPPGGGQQELAVASDGVRITFDVATVLRGGSGSVEVHYKLPLGEPALSQLAPANGPVSLAHATEALLNPWLGSHTGGTPRTEAG